MSLHCDRARAITSHTRSALLATSDLGFVINWRLHA